MFLVVLFIPMVLMVLLALMIRMLLMIQMVLMLRSSPPVFLLELSAEPCEVFGYALSSLFEFY